MRINKYLSACGVCSRREADLLVASGRVQIDGHTAERNSQADENSCVMLDGKRISLPAEKTYLKLYKPRGIECTFDRRVKNNLGDYLHYPGRVTYAGRLDRNSEGLLILTDDGDLIQKMMAARFAHEKEYEVTVDRPVTDDFLNHMRQGVYLRELGVTTRPCRVLPEGGTDFRIILTQGLNRQIRRMCESLGYRVRSLRRVRVVNIMLEDMRPGDLRELSQTEKDILFRQVMNSPAGSSEKQPEETAAGERKTDQENG